MLYAVDYIKYLKAIDNLIEAKEDRRNFLFMFPDSMEVNSVLCDSWSWLH
jgi:hypothetical protein